MPEPVLGDASAALDRLADGLLSVDDHWRVTYADERSVELLGLDGESTSGRRLWSAVEGDPALLEAECRRARTAGERVAFETLLPGSDTPVSVEVHPSETGATVVFRENDGPIGPRLVDRLLEAAPVGVLVLDADGDAVRANERAADLFGREFSLGDAELYDGAGERVPVEERPYVRALERGETVRGRRYRVEVGDEARWVEMTAVPVRADADDEAGAGDDADPSAHQTLVTTVADSAVESEESGTSGEPDEPDTELSTVLERVTSAFFALDDRWRFTYLNESAEDLIDVDADAVGGESLWEVFPEAVGTTFEREYRRAMAEQEHVSFESHYPPLDTWFEVDAYPSESGLSVYFRDVTERKTRERELERQRDALERHREDLERLVEIGDVAQAVTRGALRAESRAAVESLVCETLAGTDYYEAAWIGEATAEAGVELRAGAGVDAESLRTLADELSDVATALRRDSVQVRQNVGETDDPRQELFAERGIRSSATLPLTHGDRSYGALTVDTARKYAFAGHEREVLEGMVETVSRALSAAEHRQRYRSLVDDVLDTEAEVGIAVVDEGGRIVWLNEALEAYFRVDREDVLGREARTAVHEVLREGVADSARVTEVENHGAEARAELRVEPAAGSEGEDEARFLERRSVELGSGLYAGGRVEIFTDVTERARSKRALAERERMWSTLVGNLPGTVYRCLDEPGWPMEFVSEGVEQLTGYTAEELESGEISWGEDVVHPEDRGPLAEEVGAALSAGESFRVAYRIRTADGETRWVWEQGGPAGSGSGNVERIEGFIIDVTEREWDRRERELVEELTRETATAESLDAALLTVAERVRAETTWDHGEVWTPDEDGRLTLAAQTDDAGSSFREVARETTFDPNEGHVGRVYASGETEFLSLPEGDEERPFTRSRAAEAAGLEATVSVPVTSEDGTVAVLAFYLADGLPVPDRMVEAVETVGARLGEVLAYRRAEMARRESERERDRLVRINRLIRRITGALVAAESHEEIEQTVCRRLVEHDPYTFAWYGEPEFGDEGTVEPRTWAGREEGYLNEVRITFDESETGGGPVGRAIRSEEPVRCADIRTDEAFDPWREAALERGYRSSIAVPVSYGEAQYGVLCVYAETPDAFSGEEGQVFAELGDAVAHAKSAIYRKEGLFSDTQVQLELGLPSPLPDDDDVSEATRRREVGITVEATTARSDGGLLHYVRTEGLSAESFETVVEGTSSLTGYRRLGEAGSGRYVVGQEGSRLFDLLSTYGGRLESIDIDRERTRAVVELPQEVGVREFFDAVEERYPDATLGAQRTVTREEVTANDLTVAATDELTEKQREAVEVAYRSGYFSWPRESDGETVAEALGISPSTFHQHLRAAERKLAGVVFDGRENE